MSTPGSVGSAAIQRLSESEGACVIYDGQCPLCSAYVAKICEGDDPPEVRLVDAREHPSLVGDLHAVDIDIDEGIVLQRAGITYHGAECLHQLALMNESRSSFATVNRLLFRSEAVANRLYPLLRWGRGIVLKLLGRRPIGT